MGADYYGWPPTVTLDQPVGLLELMFHRMKEAQRARS